MKGAGEIAFFKSQPKAIRTLLVTNLLFAMVLPLIEIFAGAYIMRNTGSPSWVIVYQLCMYVGVVMSALINGSGNSRMNLAVALMDGVACRIGLSVLLGVTFAMGINGFWYGNAISGCIPFVVGFAFLLSGRWKVLKKPNEANAADN